MAVSSFEGQYVWSPAADDRALARACMDVRAGRYLSAHEVLREAREDFEVRAHRSLVLASVAADSDLAERWLAEEPGPDAALLWARVAMLRALRMADADAGDRRQGALARIAQSACERAAKLLPDDPTPWVAQLALTRLDRPQDPAPQGLLTAAKPDRGTSSRTSSGSTPGTARHTTAFCPSSSPATAVRPARVGTWPRS